MRHGSLRGVGLRRRGDLTDLRLAAIMINLELSSIL